MLARKGSARVLLSLFLVVQLLACADSDEPVVVEQPASTTQPDDDASEALFSEQENYLERVAVTHQFGETLVPAQLERVAVTGQYEEDSLIALGILPIAAVSSRPDGDAFPTPWAYRVTGDHRIVDLGTPDSELDYKRLAELEPDLVLATRSDLSRSEYEALTTIAPTVARLSDTEQSQLSWKEHVQLLGGALSLEAEADQAILVAQASIFDAIRPHPALKGASFAWLKADNENEIQVASSSHASSRFLKQLGLVYPSDLDDEVGNERWGPLTDQLSARLDVDVLLIEADSSLEEVLSESSLLGVSPSVERQEIVWVHRGTTLQAALNTVTILSLEVLLEELVPKISDVVTVVLDPPTTEELLAMEAFRLVYGSETSWSEKEPHLENAAQLRAANEAYRQGAVDNDGITLRPKAAEISNDSAKIIYDVYFGDSAAYTDLDRIVYLIDGVWQVTEGDFCDFLSAAQTPCGG